MMFTLACVSMWGCGEGDVKWDDEFGGLTFYEKDEVVVTLE